MAGAVVAASASAAWAGVVAGDQARQWLLRMHAAATQTNYQGTLVVTVDGSMTTSHLTHYCEGAQTFERVDLLDGQPRSVLRHNDELLTLWPGEKVARIERREAPPAFPALLADGTAERLFERYELVEEGPGRVAGLDAAVFLLRPRDGARFAQRLWADRASGLLLRADVVADGRVLESSAFSNVSIGAKVKPTTVHSVLKKIEGWRVQRPLSQRTTLEAEGWQLRQPPVEGFRQSSCVKRHLHSEQADGAAPPTEVLQAIFTDGLTHVSVFIEPYRAQRHRPGAGVAGATHSWMQVHGTHWVTVIGDVPLSTLKQFARALERTPR